MEEVTDCLSQNEWLSDFEASTTHSKNQGRKLTDNLFFVQSVYEKSQHSTSPQ